MLRISTLNSVVFTQINLYSLQFLYWRENKLNLSVFFIEKYNQQNICLSEKGHLGKHYDSGFWSGLKRLRSNWTCQFN